MKSCIALILPLAGTCRAFVVPSPAFGRSPSLGVAEAEPTIVSPFDESSNKGYTPTDPVELTEGPLELTWENVEAVLEEMRPYLIQDGGNVAISEIDGPVVRLELQVSNARSINIDGKEGCSLFRSMKVPLT
jgi:lysyl-tRNA synthetase class 2